MSLIHERHGSRNLKVSRDGASADFLYFVREAADEEEAILLAGATAPTTYTPPGSGPLIQQEFTTEELGGGCYHVDVSYQSGKADDKASAASSPPQETNADGSRKEGGGNVAGDKDPTEPLGREFSFSTGGGTTHILRSWETVFSVGGPPKAIVDAAYVPAAAALAIAEADRAAALTDFAAITALAAYNSAMAAAINSPSDATRALAALARAAYNAVPTVVVAAASLLAYQTAVAVAAAVLAAASAATAVPAPDYKGAIGAGDDGPAGCDVVAPDAKFQVTYKVPEITLGRFVSLCALTGIVNNSAWQGFGIREVLFLGADGHFSDGDKKWTITYEFGYSATEADPIIINGMTVPVKLGWDYLWVLYRTTEDEASHTTTKTPAAVYVERVYKQKDFTVALGF